MQLFWVTMFQKFFQFYFFLNQFPGFISYVDLDIVKEEDENDGEFCRADECRAFRLGFFLK